MTRRTGEAEAAARILRAGSAPWPAVVLLLGLAGCEPPAAPAGGGRPLAVLQRDFAWELDAPEPPAPLSLSWSFATGPEGWRLADGSAPRWHEGALAIELHDGVLLLDSPPDAVLDPELQQLLVLSGVPPADGSGMQLVVQWRAAGQEFSAERSTSPLPLTPSAPAPDEQTPGEPASSQASAVQTWSLPLEQLRGVREATDATEGLAQLRLRFEPLAPHEGATTGAAFALHAVLVLSEFDSAGPGPLPTRRLGRAGIHRPGVALRAAGVAETALQPGDGERLWLALALAGSPEPLDVRVEDSTGRLPPQTLRCMPGADWQELALDLQPLAGRRAQLRIAFASPQPPPRATLFVGGMLRLGDDGRDLPDVLLYVEDTLRSDVLGLYGSRLPTDPALAAIAAQGVVLDEVLAASNWTRPAISTLLTGLDPLAHGNTSHLRRLPASVETLAEALAAQGYQTAAFVTNYHAGSWSGLDQGFDRFDEPTAHGASARVDTLTSASIASPLAEHLQRHAGERLFVWAHSLDPHAPYQPPMDELLPMLRAAAAAGDTDGTADPADTSGDLRADRQELQDAWLRYAGEVRFNDERLAEVDAALSASGRAERTLFVFASDHGEGFGEHGQREHRKTLYQEELRVPWVLRWPGRLPAGERVDLCAGQVDMAPTLLGLLGLPVPVGWRGRDLSPVLRGSAVVDGDGGGGRPGGAAAAPVTSPSGARDVPLLVHSVREDDAGEWVAALLWPWKLIATLDASGAPQPLALHRLDTDPHETRDLLHEQSGRGARDALLAWLQRTLPESRARAAADAEAVRMSPELLRWMQAMGYLR